MKLESDEKLVVEKLQKASDFFSLRRDALGVIVSLSVEIDTLTDELAAAAAEFKEKEKIEAELREELAQLQEELALERRKHQPLFVS